MTDNLAAKGITQVRQALLPPPEIVLLVQSQPVSVLPRPHWPTLQTTQAITQPMPRLSHLSNILSTILG
jgi:hypothetical protein